MINLYSLILLLFLLQNYAAVLIQPKLNVC